MARAESSSFVLCPDVAAIGWKMFLGGNVLLTDGGLLSSSLKAIFCDDVNGTHIGASGDCQD